MLSKIRLNKCPKYVVKRQLTDRALSDLAANNTKVFPSEGDGSSCDVQRTQIRHIIDDLETSSNQLILKRQGTVNAYRTGMPPVASILKLLEDRIAQPT